MKNKVTLPIIDLGCEIKADVADFRREVSLLLLFLFLKPTHPFWLARCSGALKQCHCISCTRWVLDVLQFFLCSRLNGGPLKR